MAGTLVTAHDAEEALRPYLGVVHDVGLLPHLVTAQEQALTNALQAALELLGVRD